MTGLQAIKTCASPVGCRGSRCSGQWWCSAFARSWRTVAPAWLLWLSLFSTGSPLPAAVVNNQRAIDVFEKTVRPLLVKHCYECHGPQAEQAASGLRLDSLLSILKGGDSGPAVVPGKPEQSLLLRRVHAKDLILKYNRKGPPGVPEI